MPVLKDKKPGYGTANLSAQTGPERSARKKMGFRLQKEAKEYERQFLSKSSMYCDMRFRDFLELYILLMNTCLL